MKITYQTNTSRIIDFEQRHFQLNLTIDNEERYSRNQSYTPEELEELWNITYSYRKDLGFTNFDSDDIADFLVNRRNDKSVNEIFYTLLGGFRRSSEYPEDREFNRRAVQLMGIIDYDDEREFECGHLVLYSNEMEECKGKIKQYLKYLNKEKSNSNSNTVSPNSSKMLVETGKSEDI